MNENLNNPTVPDEFKISEHLYNALKEIDTDRRNCLGGGDQYPMAHLARIISTLIRRKNQWRVIGITKEALELLASCGFEKPPKAIQRGHLVSRADVAAYIFSQSEGFISKQELEYVLWFYDQTVLMTVDQNKKTYATPEFYKFEFDEGLDVLFASAYIGHVYGEREKNFIRDFFSNKEKIVHTIDDIYPRHIHSHK